MASKAVNVPVNEKIKEKDVNNKLQLYGIYSAFANGKVPSVRSIDSAEPEISGLIGCGSRMHDLFPSRLAQDFRDAQDSTTNISYRTNKLMLH